jgi:carbonic anhydrase/acetyltransferase-like protein (isoleucine patch superfamily)
LGIAMGEPRLLTAGIVDVRFGERVKVVQPANLYGCKIGDDCFIGPFVEIQRDVTVGARCKVQSHAFICELVTKDISQPGVYAGKPARLLRGLEGKPS